MNVNLSSEVIGSSKTGLFGRLFPATLAIWGDSAIITADTLSRAPTNYRATVVFLGGLLVGIGAAFDCTNRDKPHIGPENTDQLQYLPTDVLQPAIEWASPNASVSTVAGSSHSTAGRG